MFTGPYCLYALNPHQTKLDAPPPSTAQMKSGPSGHGGQVEGCALVVAASCSCTPSIEMLSRLRAGKIRVAAQQRTSCRVEENFSDLLSLFPLRILPVALAVRRCRRKRCLKLFFAPRPSPTLGLGKIVQTLPPQQQFRPPAWQEPFRPCQIQQGARAVFQVGQNNGSPYLSTSFC